MAPKPKTTTDPFANWRAWGDRAIRSGDPEECARSARFLNGLPANHPDLQGVTPELRTSLSDRLRRASKGA